MALGAVATINHSLVLIFASYKPIILCLPIISMVLWGMNYVSTELILRKNVMSDIMRDLSEIITKAKAAEISMEMLLKNEESFHLFMIHLSKELSFHYMDRNILSILSILYFIVIVCLHCYIHSQYIHQISIDYI